MISHSANNSNLYYWTKNFTPPYTYINMHTHTHTHTHTNIQWGILQRTMLHEQMLKLLQMLDWTLRNTITWCRMCVWVMCQAFLLWVECQLSSLLMFARFSYQFSSVICLFVHFVVNFFLIILLCTLTISQKI
jgi:hypothetical protein